LDLSRFDAAPLIAFIAKKKLSEASTIRAADTQHWGGKALSPTNEKQL